MILLSLSPPRFEAIRNFLVRYFGFVYFYKRRTHYLMLCVAPPPPVHNRRPAAVPSAVPASLLSAALPREASDISIL